MVEQRSETALSAVRKDDVLQYQGLGKSNAAYSVSVLPVDRQVVAVTKCPMGSGSGVMDASW